MLECPDPNNLPATTQKWAVYETLPTNQRILKIVTADKQAAEDYAKSIAGVVEAFETADIPVDQADIPAFTQVKQ